MEGHMSDPQPVPIYNELPEGTTVHASMWNDDPSTLKFWTEKELRTDGETFHAFYTRNGEKFTRTIQVREGPGTLTDFPVVITFDPENRDVEIFEDAQKTKKLEAAETVTPGYWLVTIPKL